MTTEAERAVLGALVLNGGLVPQAAGLLEPEDFSAPAHGALFADIVSSYREEGEVDALALGKKHRALVSEVINGLPRVTNLNAWAREIKASAVRRRLQTLLMHVSERAADPDESVYSLLGDLGREAVTLARHGKAQGWLDNQRLVDEALETIERRLSSPGGMVGLSTGLQELDLKLQGLRPGQLIGIGGRPGAGKTSLCQQVAKHVAASGTHVAFFSLEMTAAEVTEREIASDAEVNLQTLFWAGNAQEEKMARITAAAGRAMSPHLHKAEGSFSVEEVEALAVEAKTRWDVGLVVVDYFQLLQTPRALRRHEALADTSRALKGMAMRLGVPVLMALQLNRSPEGRSNRRPTLGDIAETDAPAKDCHAVILLHQGDDRTVAELIVDKNRSGYAGIARCTFIPELTKFVDAK